MKRIFILLFALFPFCLSCQTNADETEWDNYLMPGVGWKVYFPKQDSLGVYQGVVTEFVFYARATKKASKRGGPARVRTYGNLSILKSSKSTAGDIFYSNLGLNLSFEGHTDRKFMIPDFGIELGGLYKRGFSSLHFTPMLGLQLLSTKRIIWTANGGYMYTTHRFDDYSGYTVSSTVNLLLWK